MVEAVAGVLDYTGAGPLAVWAFRHMFGSLLARWLVAGCSAALVLAATAAGAQTGRVSGYVKDDEGRPIKGATVLAENPEATPMSFSAVTDEKGRFAIIGLRAGIWTFKASARGFRGSSGSGRVRAVGINSPIEFRLSKVHPTAVLARASGRALQEELAAADTLLAAGRYDEAVEAYQQILDRAPALVAINLQIGRAFRMKRDYDRALLAFQQVLRTDATNQTARLEIGLTQLDQGELDAAETTLTAAAEGSAPGREVLYGLGEVKFAKNQPDDAVGCYEKAAALDPHWARPHVRLGILAVNRGDTAAAIRHFERAIALEPESLDAAQARTFLDQIKP
jgi:Flp pilus assembly protein TadD